MIRSLLLSLLLALLPWSVWSNESNGDRSVKAVAFPKGKTETVIEGRIKGRGYVDHTLRASAGQTLILQLNSSHRAIYFNLLPPDSSDNAMAIGEQSGNRFDGLLPDDGVYTVRVFLIRAAARRNETGRYTLKVVAGGTALKPIAASKDALVGGTRFHAVANVKCAPAYTQTRECEAGAVRRSFDGTATVELRWDKTWKRRILFVKGEPKAADVPQPMTFTRNERGWVVSFGGGESFEIPEPLVSGG
jgi:hypothetical protein